MKTNGATWNAYMASWPESYWQRGFNDGYAGKHEEMPTAEGEYAPINRGYLNGYRAGREKFDNELRFRLGLESA